MKLVHSTIKYLPYILKFFIFALIPISIYNQEYFLTTASLFVLFLTYLPAIIERSFKITLPKELNIILTIALYLHYVLGEYENFYTKVSWWDLFLHSGNSIILGLIGFVFAYALLFTSRINAKPFFISLFSVSFAVTIGVLWEIFEFIMDQLFGFNMQKSGLVDTMTDLMADILGALIVSIFGFFYIKNPQPGFFHFLVKRFAKIRKKGQNLAKKALDE